METKEEISYEDFQKLDVRMGKVLSAERIPETDKLLKLSVDFGDETRQIVSGIAEYVSEDDIVGKLYPFVVNLKTRTIKGEESNGMIMAVSTEEGDFALLTPHAPIPAGSKIK